jgi:hypothetical protein
MDLKKYMDKANRPEGPGLSMQQIKVMNVLRYADSSAAALYCT